MTEETCSSCHQPIAQGPGHDLLRYLRDRQTSRLKAADRYADAGRDDARDGALDKADQYKAWAKWLENTIAAVEQASAPQPKP